MKRRARESTFTDKSYRSMVTFSVQPKGAGQLSAPSNKPSSSGSSFKDALCMASFFPPSPARFARTRSILKTDTRSCCCVSPGSSTSQLRGADYLHASSISPCLTGWGTHWGGGESGLSLLDLCDCGSDVPAVGGVRQAAGGGQGEGVLWVQLLSLVSEEALPNRMSLSWDMPLSCDLVLMRNWALRNITRSCSCLSSR